MAIDDYAIAKRFNQAPHARCREQGVGFEPVVFDHAGGFESVIFDHAGGVNEEGARILDSLSKAIGN